MFIKKSFVDEIANSMQQYMVDGAINKQAEQQNSLIKAAEYLNAVAEIFDDAGLSIQSEVVTTVLESLASKKKKDKKNTKKPSSKKMTSDDMVNNLKQKGWMFDESGADDKNHADDNCASCGDMSEVDDSLENNDPITMWGLLDESNNLIETFQAHKADAISKLVEISKNKPGTKLMLPTKDVSTLFQENSEPHIETETADMSFADDNENEMLAMLEDFKSNTKDMDFEDELDFDGFNTRLKNPEFSQEAYEDFEDPLDKW